MVAQNIENISEDIKLFGSEEIDEVTANAAYMVGSDALQQFPALISEHGHGDTSILRRLLAIDCPSGH
jgi:hypothetical protein